MTCLVWTFYPFCFAHHMLRWISLCSYGTLFRFFWMIVPCFLSSTSVFHLFELLEFHYQDLQSFQSFKAKPMLHCAGFLRVFDIHQLFFSLFGGYLHSLSVFTCLIFSYLFFFASLLLIWVWICRRGHGLNVFLRWDQFI